MNDMINAKHELIEIIYDKTIKCAAIKHKEIDKEGTEYLLPVNYTQAQYEEFLSSLDFVYDRGFGAQELFGTVWFTDGTWLERYEYDGEEEWVRAHVPKIPDKLQAKE
jgi:hypothetical protein